MWNEIDLTLTLTLRELDLLFHIKIKSKNESLVKITHQDIILSINTKTFE